MPLSDEQLDIRKVEINTFAALIHLTGSVEEAALLQEQARNHLYPKPNKTVSLNISKSVLNGLD